jgi:hypothetical protein
LRKRVSEKSSIPPQDEINERWPAEENCSKLVGDDGVLVEDLVVEKLKEYW